MIDVSEIVNDPDFQEAITILRSTGDSVIDGVVVKGTTQTLNIQGVCVNPKGTKRTELTDQGNRATGNINIYVDASSDIYTTDKTDGHETSDVIYRNYGQPNQSKYRVVFVKDYKRYGFTMAEAERLGGP